MRFVPIIIACAFFCTTTEVFAYRPHSDLKQHFEVCLEDSGVDYILFSRMDRAKFDFDEDDKANEFIRCALTNGGVMLEDGTISKDAVLDFIPDEDHDMIGAVIDECKLEIKDVEDKAKRAFRFMRCYTGKKLQA